MATTNKQLREWLSRFPDDTNIEVITTSECAGHWDSYVSVHHEDLILPNVTMSTLKGWESFDNVCFDVEYDYNEGVATGVKQITLGKAHND